MSGPEPDVLPITPSPKGDRIVPVSATVSHELSRRPADGWTRPDSSSVAEPVVDTSITEDPPKRHRSGLTRHLPKRCFTVCW